jgi:glycogen(starch) synthase
MRIAFFTYEFPPDIAQGGIATYVHQITKLLANRGHEIEVFCASPHRTKTSVEDNVIVHRLKCNNPSEFNDLLLDFFQKSHNQKPFDIIESPEIHGHAYSIKLIHQNLPLVVKFHMPIFLQMRLINFYTSKLTKLRFFLGGLRRGRIKFYDYYDYQLDLDYKVTKLADAYISPSKSLGEILKNEWNLNDQKLSFIHYPFTPPTFLLDIPIECRTTKVVSFIGKLNVQKGIVSLVEMIKKVVIDHPDVKFRIIGNDSFYTSRKLVMSDYIKKQLTGLEENYIIRGGLDYNDVMQELNLADVCIFPSIWENFPNVCLEAMSAGRAIIGSKNGGMSEMLENQAGIVIDPLKVEEGVKAISFLLDNPEERVKRGIKAREIVLESYNKEIIGSQIENHFTQVIAECQLK